MELQFTNLVIVVAAGFVSPLVLGLLSVLPFPAGALPLLRRDPKMRAEMSETAAAKPVVVPSM
jgi:hypothetical protein